MATYGDFPGIQVTTQGGAISGIALGAEEILVIFGEADLASGSGSVNNPTQIGARSEADSIFGSGSELAQAMREALANGANLEYLYGVAVDTTAVTDENFTSASGTLANAPIVEDASTLTIEQTAGPTDMDVQFVYESPPVDPANTDDTAYVNPYTGEFVVDSSGSDDYDIDYEYQEWSTALDSADNVVGEDDTGVYVTLSEAESVASTLDTKVQDLRPNYQMVVGFAGAQPNDTETDESGTRIQAPNFDTANYSDSLDSDDLFAFAPVRFAPITADGETRPYTRTVLGGISGLFAGSSINEPVYNDVVNVLPDDSNRDLEQKFTKTEEDEMAGEEVIPLRQGASIRAKRNLSTSQETDWERDYWRRRIVDRVILVAKQVGEDTIGRINDERTRNAAERTINTELESLANDRLIKPNETDDQNYFVDVYEDTTNADQVNIDVGVTPQGIVKRIDTTVTISTN